MVPRQVRFPALLLAGLALPACRVTPEPPQTDPASRAAARPTVDDDEFAKPVERQDDGLGDSKTADAIEILTFVGAFFAAGIDVRSETDPISAVNRQDRTSQGVMGSAPNAAPEAADIVDGILKRYRDGDPSKRDPRGDPEKHRPDAPR